MKTGILFEDADILVCAKPAGLAVQSARISEPDMVSELKKYLAGQNKKGPVYLGVIHRLDQPVSGVVVFAKSKRAAAALSKQITEHRMQKTYRAVAALAEKERIQNGTDGTGNGADFAFMHSGLLPGEHPLTDYMVKEPGGGARIAEPTEKEAKKAQLAYRCLAAAENRALLEIDLKTGRHHQIRVQMAHAGMPLLGDNRYGTQVSRELSARLGVRSIALQAVRLAFWHPVTGKKVWYELEEKLEL